MVRVELKFLGRSCDLEDIYNIHQIPTIERGFGNVLLAQDEEQHLWLTNGFIPCGVCEACQSGWIMACRTPETGAANLPPSTLNIEVDSTKYLTPLPQKSADLSLDQIGCILAFLGATGPAYQAYATIGMCPGDSVFLRINNISAIFVGKLLLALGMKPSLMIHSPEQKRLASCPWLSSIILDQTTSTLSSPNPHHLLVDCQPGSIDGKISSLNPYLSLSILGPSFPNQSNDQFAHLLRGQIPLRWIRRIHPHLVLELSHMALQFTEEMRGYFKIYRQTQQEDYLNHLNTLASTPSETCWPVLLSDALFSKV